MIEIKDLSFAHGKNQIFTGFDAVIQDKCATLLTGPNGSGKTTLLQLIGGVLKPSAGSIEINGKNISSLSSKEQAEIRSIAPQRRIFELAFTVEEILAIIKPKSRADHADAVIDALDLRQIYTSKITELSLGQQQRVSEALALIQHADFYLLDEPFSAQDSEYTQKLLDLIALLSNETGVLVISHNTGLIAQYFSERIELA